MSTGPEIVGVGKTKSYLEDFKSHVLKHRKIWTLACTQPCKLACTQAHKLSCMHTCMLAHTHTGMHTSK